MLVTRRVVHGLTGLRSIQQSGGVIGDVLDEIHGMYDRSVGALCRLPGKVNMVSSNCSSVWTLKQLRFQDRNAIVQRMSVAPIGAAQQIGTIIAWEDYGEIPGSVLDTPDPGNPDSGEPPGNVVAPPVLPPLNPPPIKYPEDFPQPDPGVPPMPGQAPNDPGGGGGGGLPEKWRPLGPVGDLTLTATPSAPSYVIEDEDVWETIVLELVAHGGRPDEWELSYSAAHISFWTENRADPLTWPDGTWMDLFLDGSSLPADTYQSNIVMRIDSSSTPLGTTVTVVRIRAVVSTFVENTYWRNSNGSYVEATITVTTEKYGTPVIALAGTIEWTISVGKTASVTPITTTVTNSSAEESLLNWTGALSLSSGIVGKVTSSAYSGSLTKGQSQDAIMSLDVSGIAAGEHTGTWTVSSAQADTKTLDVLVRAAPYWGGHITMYDEERDYTTELSFYSTPYDLYWKVGTGDIIRIWLTGGAWYAKMRWSPMTEEVVAEVIDWYLDSEGKPHGRIYADGGLAGHRDYTVIGWP